MPTGNKRMEYSYEMSIRDVLQAVEREGRLKKYFNMIFMRELLDFVPEEFQNIPLRDVAKKVTMPWGVPFPVEDLIETARFCEKQAESSTLEIIPLWKKQPEGFIPVLHPSTEDSVVLITSAPDGHQNKPAVIICPGGGYENHSVRGEGLLMAEKMEQAGYHAFVLLYRVKPNEYPKPQIDLALGIKYVRANAEKYGIDADNLMLMGSSAGGHLCASLPIMCNEIEDELTRELALHDPQAAVRYRDISILPEKICLNYAVISLVSDQHEDSAAALTGERRELREKLSVELQLDRSYPKTFAWACEDDDLVPVSNTLKLKTALEKNGVEHKVEIFPDGGHGCGLASGTSAQSWMKDMLEFMK